MLIRKATDDDIPRIAEIRNNVRENILSDPSRIGVEDVRWFISNPGIFVWDDDGTIAGFSAADPRDGSIWALFMDRRYEGRGIAQALFSRACAVLKGCWSRADVAHDGSRYKGGRLLQKRRMESCRPKGRRFAVRSAASKRIAWLPID